MVPLEVLLRTSRALPVAPEVLPKLQTKLLDTDSDVSDLAALIRLDAGLAASVMRVSNSAFYSRGCAVSSIEDAVSLIGYQETLRLVARCSYGTVMKGELPCYGLSGEVLWEEAVLTGIAMEQLCQLVGVEPSEGYVIGLLRSLGIVVINDHLVRSGKGALRAPTGPDADLLQWERETIGHHHGEVGAGMMRQWKFAPHMVLAVERQFEAQPRAEDGVLAFLLPLAATIAAHVRQHAEADETPPPVFDPVRVNLAGLDRRQLVDTIESIRSGWSKARESLL